MVSNGLSLLQFVDRIHNLHWLKPLFWQFLCIKIILTAAIQCNQFWFGHYYHFIFFRNKYFTFNFCSSSSYTNSDKFLCPFNLSVQFINKIKFVQNNKKKHWTSKYIFRHCCESHWNALLIKHTCRKHTAYTLHWVNKHWLNFEPTFLSCCIVWSAITK